MYYSFSSALLQCTLRKWGFEMKILVACEESQTVCKAFRGMGHEAYSCDIQPCSGGHPEWHIQDDVLPILDGFCFRTEDRTFHLGMKWDMIIAHPPCTYLCVTGNRWFNVEKYGQKALERLRLRSQAINFFMEFVNAPCKKIAIENPIGIMSTNYRKPDQIIQPYMFGEPYEKKTCLWLKGLPKIKPTDIVQPEERVRFDSGKTMPRWYAEAYRLQPSERSKVRSKTFQGIAEAMAKQWGEWE